jgi:hypothetical protein
MRNNYIKGHLQPAITMPRMVFRIEINHSILDTYEILMHELIGKGIYTNLDYSYTVYRNPLAQSCTRAYV